MVHYFDEARVQQLLSVPDLLQGVREALVALTLGQVVQPLRMVMPMGGASADGLLILKPAQLGDALSTKHITLVPGNAQKGLPTLLSTIVLMDPATGQTLAVMEGNTITAMRTAAASAVAADALVPRMPQVVAMLGSGVLARSHAQMLRAVLTALIIAIGITALVGMLTATSVMEGSITQQFSSMGATTFTIQQGGMQIQIGRRGIKEKPQPSIPLLQAIQLRDRMAKMGYVASIGDNVAGAMEVQYEGLKTNPNVNVTASDANYPATQGLTIAQGRFFSAADQNEARSVAVLGSDVAGKLFPEGDALGRIIRVGSKPYTVVGVTEPKGSSSFMSSDQVVYLPLRTAHLEFADPSSSYVISVMAPSPQELEASIASATAVMRSVRRLRPGAEDNFNIRRSDSISALLLESLSSVNAGAALIALITLLGASIALMNIMLVSVTERTREIGTRKALGASSQVIVVQFLAEAIIVSVMGGIAGIIMGLAVGNGLAFALDAQAVFPLKWMLLALVVSIVVGVVSGWYPAKKAAALDPIEALRYE